MATKEIKFNVRLTLDGKEQLVTLSTPLKEFHKNIALAETKTQKFSRTLANMSNALNGVEKITKGISDLNNAIHDIQSENAIDMSLTGLDGKELSQMQSRAKALASTFGVEYSEALQAANNLSKAFGISAQDALKLVQDGFVAGANANGEFVDTLKEYPRYFKEAGISAEEFIAITANAAKQGIYSDKGVDTIKEGNLRIREMTTATAAALDAIGISSSAVMQQLENGTTTTFQVMQQVGAKLAELPASSSKVGTAIADIFGGPGEDAGLEYIKSLADVNTSLDALTQGAGEAAQSLSAQVDAQTQINEKTSVFRDILSSLSPAMPYLNMASQVGMSIIAVQTLASTLASFNIVQTVTTYGTLALTAAKRAAIAVYNSVRTAIVAYTMATQVMTTGEVVATVATNVLKFAIRGLMIATGVGAVIAGLTFAIEALMGAADGASDSVDGLTDAQGDLSGSTESTKQAEEQMTATLQQQKAQLSLNIAELKNFKGSKEEEKKKVQEMNNVYGETLGYYQTVGQWYTALVNNSRAYCQQMEIEARMRLYANRIAEKEEKIDKIKYNPDGTKRLYDNSRVEEFGWNGVVKVNRHYKETDADRANKSIAGLRREIEADRNKMNTLAGQKVEFKHFTGYSPTAPVVTTGTKKDAKTGTTHTTATKEKTEEQKLDEQINKLEAEYPKASAKRQAAITKEIAKLKEKKEALKLSKAEAQRPEAGAAWKESDYADEIAYQKQLLSTLDVKSEKYAETKKEIERLNNELTAMQKAAARPENLYTTADYKAEIEYQEALLDTLDLKSDAYAAVSQEIERLNNEMEQMKNTGGIREVDISTIDTYDKLNTALSYYNTQMNRGNEETRRFAQTQINALNDIKDKWDKTLKDIGKNPLTIEAEEDPAKWLKGSDTDKRKSYDNAQQRASRIQTDLQIGLIGKDEAKRQLEDINKQLREMGLKPIEIDLEIKEQKRWEKFFDTTREGWNSIKGVGDGIKGITDTIEGSGDAWEKTTGVISGALEVYDGIRGVMNTVSEILGLIAAGKAAEGASTVANTAATTADATASAEAIPAATAEVVANKALTASVMELAAAKYMLAHAAIPFTGQAIGTGFAIGAAATVKSIGAMAFADGGVIYGPTIGLMGEYSGAASNPEVVAPLSKLRTMIEPNAFGGGKVEFDIKGRRLYGILRNEERVRSRR